MYTVVTPFFDKEDNMRLYEPGQIYPRKGVKPSKERFELLSNGFIEKKVVTKKSGE